MTRMELPDTIDLSVAPELGALALLDASLVVADQALRLEHAELEHALRRHDPNRPPEALVASLLTERFRELRSLLGIYVVAVRRDDIPF